MQNTDSLKPHEKEELEVVTKHLQQLQNYLKLPIGKSSEDEIGKLESLVEPLFQKENHSSHHGSWRNPMSMVKGATRKLSSKRQDGAVSGTGINEIMKTDLIPLWRDLQAKFIKIKCRDPKEDSALKLKFLRSLLVLGDYIHKNELLPQREIKKIKIFEPTTAIKLFQFHTELLIFSEGKDLFGSPEWVTPQMDLLLSNPSFGPFHRSLAALTEDHQKYVEHQTLRSIISNRESLVPEGNRSYSKVVSFYQLFLNENFIKHEKLGLLKQPRDFSRISPDMISNLWNLIVFFGGQTKLLEGQEQQVQKFHIIMSYHLIKFLKHYNYQVPGQGWPHDFLSTFLVSSDQLEYLGSLLQLAQKGFKDPELRNEVTRTRKNLTQSVPERMNKSVMRWMVLVDSLFGKPKK
ncbi:hypothetical protein PGTUg99_037212 [Puccinia graminis f. sp. tritici]|nr:hypothetical protein PGTUg99_037212 [Puccinia graminis f. sp. tritici]